MTKALTEERQKELLTLSERLGVKFRDIALLDQALTHTSFANESVHRKVVHNERLEFLGDAVLELATSTYLFRQFPMMPEGDLTKARASVVCEAALHRRATEVNLGSFLLLGHGEQATGGRERPSILADAVEALIGAVFLDGGYEAAKQVVLELLSEGLQDAREGKLLVTDYKTALQELLQAEGASASDIQYVDAGQTGPDHDKVFTVRLMVNGRQEAEGVGKSKKQAQQKAAEQALSRRRHAI